MKRRKKPAIRFKGFVNDWEQRKFKNELKISNEMVDWSWRYRALYWAISF